MEPLFIDCRECGRHVPVFHESVMERYDIHVFLQLPHFVTTLRLDEWHFVSRDGEENDARMKHLVVLEIVKKRRWCASRATVHINRSTRHTRRRMVENVLHKLVD